MGAVKRWMMDQCDSVSSRLEDGDISPEQALREMLELGIPLQFAQDAVDAVLEVKSGN